MGGFAGFGERRIGAVPAGVVGVVAGGAALAVGALATGGAVQDDFARAGRPVFVDEKFRRIGSGSRWLGDQPGFGGDFLQPGAGVATRGSSGALTEATGAGGML